MSDPTTKKLKRKVGPVRRWIGRGINLLFLAFVVWWVWACWHGRPEIAPETTVLTGPLTADGLVDYAAALDAEMAEGVTPQNNAAVALLHIFGPDAIEADVRAATFEKLGIEPLSRRGDYFILARNFTVPAGVTSAPDPGSDDLTIQLMEAGRRAWNPAEYPLVDAWLDANHDALDRAAVAASRPRYYWPINMGDGRRLMATSAGPVKPCTDLVEALAARGMRSMGLGEFPAARRDMVAALDLARHLSTSFTLVGELLAAMLYSVALLPYETAATSVALTAAQAEQLHDDLRDRLWVNDYARIIDTGERYMALDSLQRLAQTKTETGIPGTGHEVANLIGWLPIDWNESMRLTNQLYDDLRAPANDTKLSERLEAGWPPGYGPTRWMTRHILSIMAPAAPRVQLQLMSVSAESRLAQIALGLAAHRARHGEYPTAMSCLDNPGSKPLPSDPFTGKSFFYKRTADGYLLYSVGRNRTDNGGDGNEADDITLRVPPATQPEE